VLAYVDASIWITRIEGQSAYRNAIIQRMKELKRDGWRFCTSQAAVMETLCKPYRNNDQALATVYAKLFAKTKMLPNYPELFEDGLRIMRTETLKAMDSFHVALAAHYGCEHFITTDADFRNLQTIPVLWIDFSLTS